MPYTNPRTRSRTRAMRYVTSTVLYTKLNAQYDELATVVGRTKLTTLVAKEKLFVVQTPDCRTKFQKEVLTFFEDAQISFQDNMGQSKAPSVPKKISIPYRTPACEELAG